MIENLQVETRKTVRRFDFYLVAFISCIIPLFFTYNLSTDSPNIQLSSFNESTIIFSDFYALVLGVMQHSGILAVMVVISCWETFGRERDLGIDKSLYLLSPSKNDVYASKLAVVFFSGIVYLAIFLLVSLLSFYAFSPEGIASGIEIRVILLSSLSFITLYFFFVSSAFLGAAFKGSMGVLGGTIFVFILFSILASYGSFNTYLPNQLLSLGGSEPTATYVKNILIVLLYSLILLACSSLLLNKLHRKHD